MSGEQLESWYTRLRNLILSSRVPGAGAGAGGGTADTALFFSHFPNFAATSESGADGAKDVGSEGEGVAPGEGEGGASGCGVTSRSGWLALHEAAARNDMEVLDFLLRHAGTFVDVVTEDERETALLLAVKHGQVGAVKRLIKAHACLNIPNVDGLTPLLVAVQQDECEIISLLLKEVDLDVNHREYHGWAALHEAAKQGRAPLVHALLRAGADANILTNLGETPIYIACKHGHVSCVELLLRHDGRANVANSISGQTPLFIAANKNHISCVSFLINYAADANISNKDGLLPLHTAVWANSVGCLKLLIPVTDKRNLGLYTGMTPVQLAVFRHNVEALQILIENKFDVNATGCTEQQLDDSGASSPRGAQGGGGGVTGAAVTAGLSISHVFTHFGSVANLRLRTPLFLASLWNHESCIKLLLDAGADPNVDDPIQYCISNNRVDMCNLLIERGAEIKPKHMFQAKSNHMLQLLLSAGLDPTPLFQHCSITHTANEHCPLIDDWLLKHFASPEVTLKLILTLTGNVNKCARFIHVFPAILPSPSEPRSLKHLVRIAVRSKFLPRILIQQPCKHFSKFSIPETLATYLCCPELYSILEDED